MSDFNAAGIPSTDFIEEVEDSVTRKRNQLYFALSVKGLPGEPTYGIGLTDMVGENIDGILLADIQTHLRDNIPKVVTGVAYRSSDVLGYPDKNLVTVDINIVDKESGESLTFNAATGKGASI